MEVTDTLYVTTRKDWRAWLKDNYREKNEIWLVFFRKESGKERIGYNAAVEEALCFGWIDSIIKKVDEDSFAQRFTPRKPKSSYSQTNKERLRRLVPTGKVMPEVVASLGDMLEEEYLFPEDIMQALKADAAAWEHFQTYSGAYQRIRVAFIDIARKRPGVFEKRLAHFLKRTAQGKQFGNDIEDYY